MSQYTDSVEESLKDLKGVSTGSCPSCQQCADSLGFDSLKEYDEAREAGKVYEEGSFSWSGCGICGSSFGGNLEPWHWIDENNEILHENDACVDCVMYLANGDEPEEWQQHPGSPSPLIFRGKLARLEVGNE